MSKYNGKPKDKHQFRHTTEICGKDTNGNYIYGVYDNRLNKFVVKNLSKSAANSITNEMTGNEIDRMFIKLIRSTGGL